MAKDEDVKGYDAKSHLRVLDFPDSWPGKLWGDLDLADLSTFLDGQNENIGLNSAIVLSFHNFVLKYIGSQYTESEMNCCSVSRAVLLKPLVDRPLS